MYIWISPFPTIQKTSKKNQNKYNGSGTNKLNDLKMVFQTYLYWLSTPLPST
jgi:hypothetical protein